MHCRPVVNCFASSLANTHLPPLIGSCTVSPLCLCTPHSALGSVLNRVVPTFVNRLVGLSAKWLCSTSHVFNLDTIRVKAVYSMLCRVQVASWGGYSFIINLLPIHCLACIFLGRMNSRLYVAYAPFIILGTIEAASIPVVGFNAVLMSEHFGSFLAFGVLHAAMGMQYIKVGIPLHLLSQSAIHLLMLVHVRIGF